MYIIAGLGNPTKKYEHTRHNTGFEVIDKLAGKHAIKMKRSRFTALVGQGEIGGVPVILVKPQTFMNLSGEAVGRIVKYYKADPAKDLVVIYDDTDLDVGKLRIKTHGSAGGHNGMKSIIAHLGSEEFARIRVGIGSRNPDTDMADYVLSRFDGEDRKQIDLAIGDAADAVEVILAEGIDRAMNRFNGLQRA